MEDYRKRILKERLKHLEYNKSIIEKRLQDIDGFEKENILNTLIGKYYKELKSDGINAIKVTDWFPQVRDFEFMSDHITIILPTKENTYTAAYYSTGSFEWMEGSTPEEAYRKFLKQFEEITEAEYNGYKKKAIEMLSKGM